MLGSDERSKNEGINNTGLSDNVLLAVYYFANNIRNMCVVWLGFLGGVVSGLFAVCWCLFGFLWGFLFVFVLFVFGFGFFNTNCSPSPQYIITDVSFSIGVYCWVDHF